MKLNISKNEVSANSEIGKDHCAFLIGETDRKENYRIQFEVKSQVETLKK